MPLLQAIVTGIIPPREDPGGGADRRPGSGGPGRATRPWTPAVAWITAGAGLAAGGAGLVLAAAHSTSDLVQAAAAPTGTWACALGVTLVVVGARTLRARRPSPPAKRGGRPPAPAAGGRGPGGGAHLVPLPPPPAGRPLPGSRR